MRQLPVVQSTASRDEFAHNRFELLREPRSAFPLAARQLLVVRLIATVRDEDHEVRIEVKTDVLDQSRS
jgi:hypothetical protein